MENGEKVVDKRDEEKIENLGHEPREPGVSKESFIALAERLAL